MHILAPTSLSPIFYENGLRIIRAKPAVFSCYDNFRTLSANLVLIIIFASLLSYESIGPPFIFTFREKKKRKTLALECGCFFDCLFLYNIDPSISVSFVEFDMACTRVRML